MREFLYCVFTGGVGGFGFGQGVVCGFGWGFEGLCWGLGDGLLQLLGDLCGQLAHAFLLVLLAYVC